MAGWTPLKLMGEDAFKDGFLSKIFGNSIIKRLNAFCNFKLGWAADGNDFKADLSDEGINIQIKKQFPDPPYQQGDLVLTSSKTVVKWKSGALNSPWQFLDNGDGTIKVNPYSYLFKLAVDGTAESTISGITDSTTYGPGDISAGDYAYVLISQASDGSITSIDLYIDPGTELTSFPKPYNVHTSPDYITGFAFYIGKFIAPTSDEADTVFKLGAGGSATNIGYRQLLNQHQLEVLRVVDGLVGISTEAWQGI